MHLITYTAVISYEWVSSFLTAHHIIGYSLPWIFFLYCQSEYLWVYQVQLHEVKWAKDALNIAKMLRILKAT